MIRKKIIRRVVRLDGIVQAERPERKAFSTDDWFVGVPVAGCLTGLGLHGIVFQKIFVSHSTRSPGPGAKGDGILYFGQTAQVIGIIFVLVGVFMSTKVVFADNLSRRWRIIHFIASVVIAIFFFSVGGQRL